MESEADVRARPRRIAARRGSPATVSHGVPGAPRLSRGAAAQTSILAPPDDTASRSAQTETRVRQAASPHLARQDRDGRPLPSWLALERTSKSPAAAGRTRQALTGSETCLGARPPRGGWRSRARRCWGCAVAGTALQSVAQAPLRERMPLQAERALARGGRRISDPPVGGPGPPSGKFGLQQSSFRAPMRDPLVPAFNEFLP